MKKEKDNKFLEIPEAERPYERCIKSGPEYLTDSELLSVILRTGTYGLNAIELSRSLIASEKNGLISLIDKTYEELIQIKGVGKVKAVQILCLFELSKRISMQKAYKELNFSNPDSIAKYYMEEMRHNKVEVLLAMYLDSKNNLIKDKIITKGSVNQTLAYPREVFYEAIKLGCASVIIMHNHPSGSSKPSKEDIAITKRFVEAGKLLGIPLLDHIIIGDQNFTSLKQLEVF